MNDDPLYLTPFGDTLRWIAGGEQTAGAYAMLERVAPPGTRSPGHQHRRSEAFYVIDGEVTFTIDGQSTAARAGTFVIAPEFVSHGWENTGDRAARVLLIFAPAAQRAYFADLDVMVRSAAGGQLDEAALTDLMKRHDWL